MCINDLRGKRQRAGMAEKGFTLLEIMIAIVILAVGILAVGALQITATNRNNHSNSITEAKSWCTDQVEQLLALDYRDPALTPGVHPPITRGQYTIQWTISENTILRDLTLPGVDEGPEDPNKVMTKIILMRATFLRLQTASVRFRGPLSDIVGLTKTIQLVYVR